MMTALIARAEALARARQLAKLREIAERLKALLGEAAVEVADGRVLLRGRGIVRRWLVDPGLRFLAGALK